MDEKTKQILRSCPRWIISADMETRSYCQVGSSPNAFNIVYSKYSDFEVASRPPSDYFLHGLLTEKYIPAKCYTGKAILDVSIGMGHGNTQVKTKDKIYDMTSREEAPISMLWKNVSKDNKQIETSIHCGHDENGRFTDSVFDIILPIYLFDQILTQLTNLETTTDVLYELFPERVISHFAETFNTKPRVVASLDNKIFKLW